MSETNYAPHIPEAVRRAAARADELAREAGVANTPEADGEDTTTVVTDEQQFDLGPQPEDQPQAQPEPQPQAQPQPQTDWEQRYNTLQGKYNTELPELRGQVRSLQEMVASMQAQQPRLPEASFERQNTHPSPLPQTPIPQEDYDAYGEDLINGVQRWSEARVMPRMAEFERRLATVEGGNQQLQNYTATQSVDQALNRAVPDWDAINHDPNFILWLSQVDMLSGRTRKQMIDEAYASGDANRTIAFFRAYKNEQTVTGQVPGTQPYQTGAEAPADRLPLAELAVPGRGASVPSPAPGAPQRRIWTASDVNAFYRQKSRGLWIGREAEAERIERDIIVAPTEGRFRQ